MKKQFDEFCQNIKLTANQREDAKTKYSGVCKKLHDKYYNCEYDGKTKLLFGSYKTKTNTRPLSEDQDVDVLFKIPKKIFEKFDNYESNGQAALLQEFRTVLSEKYTTTDRISAWGKVVLVKFAEKYHNVEVLPAFEKEDGTFLIPNSEDGGSWEIFDPRKQLEEFRESNENTAGLTGDLVRMMKTWVKTTSTLSYKSYKLVGDVIDFLNTEFENGADYEDYHEVVKNFLEYLKGVCDSEIIGHVNTALNRAVKAMEYMDAEKMSEASDEWRKIFGNEFPKVNKEQNSGGSKNESRVIVNPSAPWAKL